MRLHLIVASALAFALLAVSAARAGAPELSKTVRVYRGDEGVRVAVAVVLPKTEGKAVVRVSGTDSPIDDVVFLTDVEDLGERGATFRITWRGRPFGILTSRWSWWGGSSLELHVPEQPSRHLGYDDAESKKTLIATLASGLERDKGKVAAFAKFDRAAAEKRQELALRKTSDAVKAACGVPLAMSVDWKSIDDTTLQSRSVASFCGAPLERLARLCKDKARAAFAQKKIRTASCRFGPSLKLTLEGGQLGWQTKVEASNQGDFAAANLENLLQ